jgi:hypothetical protein
MALRTSLSECTVVAARACGKPVTQAIKKSIAHRRRIGDTGKTMRHCCPSIVMACPLIVIPDAAEFSAVPRHFVSGIRLQPHNTFQQVSPHD